MSELAHATLVAKIVELLQAAAPLTGVTVYRNRLRPLGTGASRAIVVRKVDSDPAGPPMQFGGGQDWETRVRIECYARATGSETAHEPCDDLLLEAHAVVAQNPTLDGLAIHVSAPRLGWDEDDTDTAIGAAIAQYAITHRTASQSLTA